LVYFARLGDDGPIKIGTTGNLASRVKQLAANYECSLEVLGVMPGGRRTERMVHERFRGLRLGRSEQFQPGEPLLDFIKCYAKQWVDPNPRAEGDAGAFWALSFYMTQEQTLWMERLALHSDLKMLGIFEHVFGRFAKDAGFDEPMPDCDPDTEEEDLNIRQGALESAWR
jgi:hypothetical protein